MNTTFALSTNTPPFESLFDRIFFFVCDYIRDTYYIYVYLVFWASELPATIETAQDQHQ